MNIVKEKVYKNGAILVYKKRKKKCTAVSAGFIFGQNRKNYSEPTAHFCEHMLFCETETKSREELTNQIKNVFSNYNNAHTSYFSLFQDYLRSNKIIEECFKLGSDMLLNTKFSKKNIESEKGVIKEERLRKLNIDNATAYFNYLKTIRDYLNNPTDIVGTKEEIEKITSKELQRFRDEVFISQNFVILIEGGLSYHKSKKFAEKYYISKLKSNPNYKVDKDICTPSNKTGNLQILNLPKISKSICNISIKLDDTISLQDKISSNYICSINKGFKSNLCNELRKKGLIYSDTYLSMQQSFKNNFFCFNFSCANENVNKVIDIYGKYINGLKTNTLDNSIIKHIQDMGKYQKDELVTNIYPSPLFYQYRTNLETKENTFSKSYIKNHKKLYKSETAEDIQAFVNKYFSTPENVYVSITTNASPETFYSYEKIQNIITKCKTKAKKQK